MALRELPDRDIEAFVLDLAAKTGVTDAADRYSKMASVITSLSGDDVVLDSVERLLVNLKMKGVIEKSEMLALQSKYLQEIKPLT
jgi:hypothetical protein